MPRRPHELGSFPSAMGTNAENEGYVAPLDISSVTDVIERIWLTPSVVDVELPGLFWDKIPRGLPDDECWPWRGSISAERYAIYGEASRYGTRYAHLLMWRHRFGPVPDGFEVDHSCFNRACMNPGHHRLLTLAENRRHHDPATRKRFCPKGHERSPLPSGKWVCRECVRVATRRWREQQALAS